MCRKPYEPVRSQLPMRGKSLSPELRAQIIAALLSGKAVNAIARQFSLTPSTVSSIHKTLTPEQTVQVRTDSRSRLDDLLVEAVAANLAAQRFILDAICDAPYLKQHDPEKVGSLFGQIGDRAVRILEIAGPYLAAHAEDDPI